ncbi:MAG: (2Fe-2S)-binding protein [Gemmatimonadetes bacterium]|nr:(2Fe-2S)-binding protein [Gemmatimonadota bacterium]
MIFVPADGLITVTATVNGILRQAEVAPRTLLSDLLRDHLRLTGTNVGCEHGYCGACTVLVDGVSVRSCLMLAPSADGTDIRTVEGLGDGDGLSPLQQAFQEKHGLQCGFCTPGMLITATELLESNPSPDEEAIRHAIAGNICRCTGYVNIVDAIRTAGTGEARS